MEIIILPHAKERMEERGLSQELVYQSILRADRVEIDRFNSHRYCAKKIYHYQNKKFLLIIIYEIIAERINIITVISTSKVNKYLK